ncbi:DUF6346 domain-containing protein [Micromonospora sp. NPDC047467]|uniref:DUF6346 domain-containing protein n=1 Tax=Micromonospora sp. NPDC047467 TaxID=3154814 RepID=UPI0033FABA7F
MFGADLMGPDIYSREMRLWQSLGPGRYRLRSACLAVLLALASVVVFLGSMTIASLFGGVHYGHPARVVVGDCQQVGPISRRGFGYWWECDAVVTAPDGMVWTARIHASDVVPEDRGRSVELRESCHVKGDVTDCSYGRPTGYLLIVGLQLIVKLGWVALVFGGLGVVMFLTGALLGAPRYLRFRGRRPSTAD